MIDYIYITDNDSLREAVNTLSRSQAVAFDLEADSMYHYQERVCLIQMAQNGRIWVIDPLEIDDMEPLRDLFADASVEKIFHGADYDIRSLYRDFRIEISNLFDTELASRFLGVSQTGLANILSARFDVFVEKKYQKKDWSKRPLPPEMLAYAAGDVVYLHALTDLLKAELKEAGREKWVREECRLLTQVRPAEKNNDPLFLRFQGAGRMDRRSLAVLEAVLQVRDRMARKRDRPVFKIMGSRTIRGIVSEKPVTLADLKKSRVMSDKQIAMYANEVLAAVKNAMDLSPEDLPAYPRIKKPAPDPRLSHRIKALKSWRETIADSLDIPAGQLINNLQIAAIATVNPRDKTALLNIDGIKAWQVKAFGDAFLAVLTGKV
ncbi:MAG: ribonuclease D [Deltaproteobacteria bacterium]|nr:MAG: ribonuclease D [Deltaproteobacteria bacterium]